MTIQLPPGFRLAAPDGSGHDKMWLSGNQFYEDAWAAAYDLSKLGPFSHVYCLARGGYPFGAVVGNCFGTNDIPSLLVSSYLKLTQHDVKVVGNIPFELFANKGEGLLLLDDLFDTGKTARTIKQTLPKSFFASVYAKPAGEAVADYFYRAIDDIWVVFPWEQPPHKFVPA